MTGPGITSGLSAGNAGNDPIAQQVFRSRVGEVDPRALAMGPGDGINFNQVRVSPPPDKPPLDATEGPPSQDEVNSLRNFAGTKHKDKTFEELGHSLGETLGGATGGGIGRAMDRTLSTLVGMGKIPGTLSAQVGKTIDNIRQLSSQSTLGGVSEIFTKLGKQADDLRQHMPTPAAQGVVESGSHLAQEGAQNGIAPAANALMDAIQSLLDTFDPTTLEIFSNPKMKDRKIQEFQNTPTPKPTPTPGAAPNDSPPAEPTIADIQQAARFQYEAAQNDSAQNNA